MEEKEIDFAGIEKKWQKEWEKAKCFEASEDSKKKKFYNLEMFPYPSGSGLHMGHALNYTIGDIYARFKRMSGYNVLYPMGYDSFGLPAENAAIKADEHPKKYTEKSMANFAMQQKALGLSYDWSRIVKTCEPEYYKWDQFFFLKFYEKGLVYRKKAAVNWCPKCDTVLANEQVHGGMCWRHTDTPVEIMHLEQWFIKTTKYSDELLDLERLEWPERIKTMQANWIGKSFGTEIDFEIENPEKKLNCIIVHGSNSDEKEAKERGVENTRHWHPWLKRKLEEKGIKVSGELYPVDWKPDYKKWKNVFEKNTINENTILVGHSAGCAFLLRWLSEIKKQVKKVILVAPYVLDTPKAPFLSKLVNFEINEDIKNCFGELIIFYSDNDNKCIIESANFINKKLGGKIIEFKGKGHFTLGDMKTEEFPELLNAVLERWPIFTTRPDTIYGVTFMVVSAQHPRLSELVTREQKKEVEAFLGKIKSTSEKNIEELEKEGVFTGSYAINPLTKEKIPVYAGNFVVAEYGAGMVMAVPAHDQRDFEFAKKYNIPVKIVIQPENKKLDKNLKEAYVEEGVLVNSDKFDGMSGKKAIDEITKLLENKKLGKKAVNYKFRDWLVSRQRYWGTPIPIIYCDKCGIVTVPEKDLPVLLPEKVKFGKGNPLATSKEFIETKCPKCNQKAKRETDTMDTFFDSSWYFLRYCDPENSKKPFDYEKINYWMPVDQYIGGAEHACMHLIYARFFTKALRDLGFVKIDEPFPKLFNQGMLHGSDGNKMSKSLGNVVNPIDMINKYSADSLRMNLMSLAAPDNDSIWNENGMESSLKFILKVSEFFKKIKIGKSGAKTGNKINKRIKEISVEIENFRYNIAIIKLRELFESFEQEISKKDAESFLKMLHPICPHITEELWHNLGNKTFISLEQWPVADESKINPEIEKQEQQNEQLFSDINNILRILKEKNKKIKKIYLYALPKEVKNYDIKFLEDKLSIEIEIYSVADKNKHDPQGKAGKAKPGKPAIYVE